MVAIKLLRGMLLTAMLPHVSPRQQSLGGVSILLILLASPNVCFVDSVSVHIVALLLLLTYSHYRDPQVELK